MGHQKAAAIGCLVWLGAYKVVLHWWFWPTAPEYHIVTLPPLILLLLLDPIARRAEPSRAGPRGTGPLLAPIALLALVALTDFAGAIAPWHRYGAMKEALAERARAMFRADDLLVSSESGIDSVLGGAGEHLRVKDAFVRASVPYALCGGLLLAAYGEPRETTDADLVVAARDADRAIQALGARLRRDLDAEDERVRAAAAHPSSPLLVSIVCCWRWCSR